MEWWRSPTAGAIAIIVWLLSSTLVGGLITIVATVLTVMRPGIIGFLAACAGAVAGVELARMACDRLVENYSGRAIFWTYVAVVVVAVVLEIAIVPPHWGQLATAASLVITLVVAHKEFAPQRFENQSA